MGSHKGFGLLIMALAAVLFALPAFSQSSEPTAKAPEAAGAPAQTEALSIYGEVNAVDAASNSIKVLYYDYDSDEEKTIDLVLDKDTKLENAKSVSDIKQLDWVDATYVVKDSKNVATSMIVEKEEEPVPAAGTETPAPAEEEL